MVWRWVTTVLNTLDTTRSISTAPASHTGDIDLSELPGRRLGWRSGDVFSDMRHLHLIGRRASALEDQAVASGIGFDDVAFLELSLKHGERERIEHAALDGALQGTRAVHGIVALFNNPIFCRLCQDEVNLPIRKPLQEGRELNVDDVPDLAASKRVEKDDVVHAVQELRFE